MNNVQFIGRLTKDPVLRLSETAEAVCSMRLAVDRMGERGSVGYIDIATYGRPAEACARHLTTGWLVGVNGRLRYREWTARDGSQRSGLSVVGRVEFLAAPRTAGEETKAAA